MKTYIWDVVIKIKKNKRIFFSDNFYSSLFVCMCARTLLSYSCIFLIISVKFVSSDVLKRYSAIIFGITINAVIKDVAAVINVTIVCNELLLVNAMMIDINNVMIMPASTINEL